MERTLLSLGHDIGCYGTASLVTGEGLAEDERFKEAEEFRIKR